MIAPSLSAAIGVTFGAAMFAYAWLLFSGNSSVAGTGKQPPARIPTDSTDGLISKTSTLLSHISKLGLILGFIVFSKCYFVDANLFGQNLDFILFAIGAMFAASCATITRIQYGDKRDQREVLLPRSQTDECKGIMQAVLLIIQRYERLDDTGTIRLLFASMFLWLTGFCHATYHLSTSDYSIRRVLLVLLRYNLLALLLSFALGVPSEILAYPACSVHSIAYLLVYGVTALSSRGSNARHRLQRNVSVLSVILILLSIVSAWIVPPLLLATMFGVTLAMNRSEILRQLQSLDTGGSVFQVYSKRLAVLVSSIGTTAVFFSSEALFGKKMEAIKPVFVLYAPIGYTFVRNSVPSLREHTLALFATIGSVSLELYVLYRHLCGTPSGYGGLVGYSKMHILLTGALCYFAARSAKAATNAIIDFCFSPPNTHILLQGFIAFSCVFALCLAVNAINLLTIVSLSVMASGLGFSLFRKILETRDLHISPRFRFKMHLLCCAATIVFGVTLHFALPVLNVGDSRADRLNKVCEESILKGSWVNVDTCTDPVLEATRRNFAIASFGTCDNLQWAWNASRSQDNCLFTHRKPEQMLQNLQGQRLTFIGDSEIRHLYYAFCRSFGDSFAGAYNTSMEKHSDIVRRYGDVSLDFYWASFVQNLSSTLDDVVADPPDAIVLGGGAWDRLQRFKHEDEQIVLRHAVSDLARYLQSLKDLVPIVWVTPTTINTWALNTEEKRNNIREEQMQAFRELYSDEGIDRAASFLLDGTSYTKHRVDECYDGVHYPFSVYDGGAQILANAFDWLLVDKGNNTRQSTARTPPIARLTIDYHEYFHVMIAMCMGLFALDHFCGSFYISSVFWPELRPRLLHSDDNESSDTKQENDGDGKSGFD